MNARFHLAFPVTDLAETRAFYEGILGCRVGRSAERWIDFDFFGHQISAHLGEAPRLAARSLVEDKEIPVPHFGALLSPADFTALEKRLRDGGVTFVIEPFTRFRGKPGEQRTMFLRDPAGNCLEFKSFQSEEQIFANG